MSQLFIDLFEEPTASDKTCIFLPILQVWGVKGGPYEFKPAPASSFDDAFNPLSFASQPLGKRIEGSFVLQE